MTGGETKAVRPATEDDAMQIAVVQVDGWRAAYRDIMPALLLAELTVEKREPSWRRLLTQSTPRTSYWVCADGPTILGFASVGPSRDDDGADIGEVYAMYAAPHAWGSGVGRALMKRATDALRDAGFATATLWVLEKNTRGRRFYECAGFRPDGAIKDEDIGGARVREVRYRTRLK